MRQVVGDIYKHMTSAQTRETILQHEGGLGGREEGMAHAVLPDGFVISNQWPASERVVLVPVQFSFPKNLSIQLIDYY